jgi:hypothetical protein
MSKPKIEILGTIDCDVVETTPIVFNDRLYRFEYIRKRYYANDTENSYFRFYDVESGDTTASFAQGYHLGSALVEGDKVYVFGVDEWGGENMKVFCSKDLINWESCGDISLKGFAIYNNSVCKNSDGKYIMLIELGKPVEEIGIPFTARFLESNNLRNWQLLPLEYMFGKDFYTGGHFLTFESGYYYLTYLESLPGPLYETYITRTKDLVNWERSLLNPFMAPSSADKKIANSTLSKEQIARTTDAVNLNSSDHEFCEFQGKTIMYYSWGNQKGAEFLAEAKYDGTIKNMLKAFFPGNNNFTCY